MGRSKVCGWLNSVVVVPQATIESWEGSGTASCESNEDPGPKDDSNETANDDPNESMPEAWNKPISPQPISPRHLGGGPAPRQRYSHVVPFNRLPGPVEISQKKKETTAMLISELIAVVEGAGTRITTAQVFMIATRVRSLQTELFIDLERNHGPRNSAVVQGFRYNLKAFCGPVMDYCREFQADIPILPPGIIRAKANILLDLLGRIYHMDDPSLY